MKLTQQLIRPLFVLRSPVQVSRMSCNSKFDSNHHGKHTLAKRPQLEMPDCRGVDIEEISISRLQKCLTERKFSARDLTATYLQRIEGLNSVLKYGTPSTPAAMNSA